ncbi:MAG: FAD-dependent oxidoreductase, partial [Gammaproteobacteria bacterium]|nr:FAD-dependent oxidoreductase [Gammaproteobacteria bacterium]
VDVEKSIRNPFYIGDQPAGTEVSGGLDAWTPAPSVYAVKARNAADVAAAVNFAREKHLRLVVKGGGHSYQGTSNAADSLLVWTRAMNQVTSHDAFVPQGCAGKTAPVPAVTAGPGAMWIDLYHEVTTVGGRYVQGGGCSSVGTAGLVQSGGFGSFSKGFGTAAAHLLEAEVVTADGTVRTVNACNDPDLFWALKGGGGGSWGIVTRQTLRTFDLPAHFGSAWGTIKARSDTAFRKLIARFVEHYAGHLFNPHWGEQAHLHPDNTLEISMVCQGLDAAEAEAAWAPFFAWVRAAQDLDVCDEVGTHAGPARHWWDVLGNPGMIPDWRPGTPAYHGWWQGDWGQVGAFLHGFDSLWLPAELLRAGRQAALTEALFAASRHKEIQLHFNKGIAGAGAEAIAATRETATNPAVLDAFVLAIIADGESPAFPGMPGRGIDKVAAHADADKIASAAAALRKLAPDAGSYVSESNYFNPRWQAAYWGGNYPRLQQVKAKYDPTGLFFGHNGVGSENWSRDGFTRLR